MNEQENISSTSSTWQDYAMENRPLTDASVCINDLHNKVHTMIRLSNTLEAELIEYFKNAEWPLTTRWELFCLSVQNNVFHKINSCYYDHYILDDKNLAWYDNFHLERGETANFPWVVKYLIEMKICTEEEIAVFKEDILAIGYSGFKFDW